MPSFGQNAFSLTLPAVSGRPASTIANPGSGPRYKVGGVTLDWTTVGAVTVQTTDALTGNVTLVGQHALRFGTVLCRITATGKYGPFSGAIGGTTLNGAVIIGQTAVPLASATGINPGDTLLIAAGGGTAESLVVSFVTGNTVTFTSGATSAHTTGAAVTKPDDGRQALRRGECFILDHTIIREQEPGSDIATNCYDGLATVYLQRVASDFGSQGVATNPTRAQLEAGFPTLDWLIE